MQKFRQRRSAESPWESTLVIMRPCQNSSPGWILVLRRGCVRRPDFTHMYVILPRSNTNTKTASLLVSVSLPPSATHPTPHRGLVVFARLPSFGNAHGVWIRDAPAWHHRPTQILNVNMNRTIWPEKWFYVSETKWLTPFPLHIFILFLTSICVRFKPDTSLWHKQLFIINCFISTAL